METIEQLEQAYGRYIQKTLPLADLIRSYQLRPKVIRKSKQQSVCAFHVFSMKEPFIGVVASPILEHPVNKNNKQEYLPTECYINYYLELFGWTGESDEAEAVFYQGIGPGRNRFLYLPFDWVEALTSGKGRRVNRAIAQSLGTFLQHRKALREQREALRGVELSVRVAYEMLRLGLKHPNKVMSEQGYYYALPFQFDVLGMVCGERDITKLVEAIKDLEAKSVLKGLEIKLGPLGNPTMRFHPEPLLAYVSDYLFF